MILPSLNDIPQLTSKSASSDNLGGIEKMFISMVDGRSSLKALAEMCGLDESLILRIAENLITKEVIAISYRNNTNSENSKSSANSKSSVNEKSDNFSFNNDFVKDIDSLYDKYSKMNYYMILGVEPDAERSDIRQSYFKLSKEYHPDAYFGKIDSSQKDKLGKIFHILTTAYETLSFKSRRARYDESISGELEMWKMESQLKRAVKERNSVIPEPAPRKAKKSNPIALSSENPLSRNSVYPVSVARRSPQPVHAVEYNAPKIQTNTDSNVPIPARRGAARISRVPISRDSVIPPPNRPSVITGNSSSIPPDSTSSASSRNSSSDLESAQLRDSRREQWKRERLRKALGRSVPPPQKRQSTDPAMKESDVLVHHATLAIENHEFDLALSHLAELKNRNISSREIEHLRLKAESGKLKFESMRWLREGRFEYGKGNIQEALSAFQRSMNIDPGSVEARYYVALCLYESKSDLPRSLSLIKEVIGLGGRKGKYYFLMGNLLLMSGDKKRATDSFQRAVKEDPDNREYQKVFKTVR
ncbi:MAG: DnaJ domain-containing protein [Deltaproteobacteria bacterium]|nr:DnaJ domain-containing protein [Deltaproteobacteria bacterium]